MAGWPSRNRNIAEHHAALGPAARQLVHVRGISSNFLDKDASISALIGEALLSKRYRDSGKIYYAFGKGLAKQILAPRAFARLRCHVVMALRSKYASRIS